MHSTTIQKKLTPKQQAKQAVKANANPGFITQVNKDDDDHDKKQSTSSVFSLYRCCSYLWRCMSFKKDNFAQINDHVPTLLPPQAEQFKGRKVLVLDLDETLVHSTFEPVKKADIILPVHLNGQVYKINVIIRPGCEDFLARVKDQFEVVVFTASLPEYAEPLVKKIDPTGSITSLLFRQHCTPLNGVYVKDMSILGRDPKDIILVDNSPNSFLFQPENAYHIKNFFDDKSDRELVRLTAFLDNMLEADVEDVRPISQLRQRYEPRDISHLLRVFKTTHIVEQEPDQEQSQSELNSNGTNSRPKRSSSRRKKPEEREKIYTVETEPAIRRGKDEVEEVKAPLTERGTNKQEVAEDNSEIELPSPKESDNLINHRQANGYYVSTSNETAEDKKSKRRASASNKDTVPDYVTVEEEPIIDGQKVDTVRFLTNCENLNSPLGRHAKIEFNNNKKEIEDQEIQIDL